MSEETREPAQSPTAAQSFRRYFQVLAALLRKEEDSRRAAPMDSIVNLLEPIIMIATISFIFYFLNRRQISPLGGSPVLFYATGFFPLYLFIYVSRRMQGAIDSPHRRLPIEQRLDHILVHIILRIVDYTILGLLLFGFLYLFLDHAANPSNLVPVVVACAAIVMLGFGWGVLFLLIPGRHWAVRIVHPAINRSLIIFSGVIFIADFLPPDPRYWLSFNPLLHAIALFRTGFYPQYPAIIFDTSYLAASAAFFLLFGFVLERISRRSEGHR